MPRAATTTGPEPLHRTLRAATTTGPEPLHRTLRAATTTGPEPFHRTPRAFSAGIVADAVRGRHVCPVVLLGALCVAAGLLAGGCGGSEMNAHEAAGRFPVQIVHASFPASQSIARPARMVLRIHNPGSQTIPNAAVTVDSFSYISNFPELAARQRPVWIIDRGPGTHPLHPVQTETVDPAGGGETAFLNTWALGSLPPGATHTFVWLVTPVKGGTHVVHYTVSAGLNGKARARIAGGGFPVGHFAVNIAGTPPPRHVDPETGKVVPGPYPYNP